MLHSHKNKTIKLGWILVLILFSLFLFAEDNSQTSSPSAALGASPDAIATRVMPNPDHYSPLTWYKKNIKLQGSPQSLTVDGYEAVRDGRTVYVNAANIDLTNNNFYTNIYIISYNQNATSDTVDIFGQLLAYWKFNTNLNQAGLCSKTAAKACLRSADCPTGEYCLSLKARTIRDTKRLSELADMKIALDSYKAKNNKFPTLSAGSYLSNQTLSVWPSWRETLAKTLGVALPLDSINKLGACSSANYNPDTCWDEKNKKFDGVIPANLPAGSLTYAYSGSGDGLTYGLCANMESGYLNITQGACSNVDPNNNITGSIPRETPLFTGSNLPNINSGQSYQGFIQASRPGLVWTMAPVSDCDLWTGLRLLSTSVPTQRKVAATKAGVAGQCKIAVTISDRGLVSTQEFTINVANPNLPVIQPIANQTVVIGQDMNLTVSAAEADGQYPLTYEFTGLPGGLTNTVLSNGHDNKISGQIVDTLGDHNVTVTALDLYRGRSATINFTITITNQPPTIPSIPDKEAIIGRPFTFTIPATDSDGPIHYPLTFTVPTQFSAQSSFNVVTNTNNHDAEISGTLVEETKDYNLAITAKDKYDLVSSPQNFKIILINHPPVLPDQTLPTAIGCSTYTPYQILATDPDLHAVNKFIITGLPAGLSASEDGKITGIPNVPAGSHAFTVAARDQYYDQTIAPYSAETTRDFNLTVVDESFIVNPISDATIYTYPTGATLPLYYGPIQFNATASVTTATPVIYSLINNPAWLTINPNTGVIQGTPTDNVNDIGDKTVIVRATTNGCNVAASKNFTIHVLANSWCGDGVVSNLEQCDDGNQNDNDDCDNSCQGTCQPDCTGRTCGSDGCYGSCGTCSNIKDVCYQNNCWTLMAHDKIGRYNKDNLFWKGILGSNVNFNFNGQTYNSGTLENTIRTKPFQRLKIFDSSGDEQVGMTFSRNDTTFAQKLAATEGVSGGEWYPFYNGTWTYVEALLGYKEFQGYGDYMVKGLGTYGYTSFINNGECPQEADHVTMSVGYETHRTCAIYYDWYALILGVNAEWTYITGNPDSNIKCKCNGQDYGDWVSCYDISACHNGPAIVSYCRNTYGTAICN